MGRPSKYTQELADKICLLISEGESLRSICEAHEMPTRPTVYNWFDSVEGFFNQYTRARKEQADYYAQEIVHIADTEEDPHRAKIRIDARKWVASKLKGSLYGDKQQIDHTTQGEKINGRNLSDDELMAIAGKAKDG